MDNIRYSKSDATDEQVIKAAKIAHRLSTIRDADHIMVIGNGKILEIGNHKSLMEKKGQYYNMVISQMGKLPDGV